MEFEQPALPPEAATPDPKVALPQHLTPAQQDRLRALLDGQESSNKEHVRDTLADFTALKRQLGELDRNIAKASSLLSTLRMEYASTRGAMDKCIRDVTRWEIDPRRRATTPPPASVPIGGKRKTKRRGKR